MLQCRRRTRSTRQIGREQALGAAVCDHDKERQDQARVAAGVGAGVNLWIRANFRGPIMMQIAEILDAGKRERCKSTKFALKYST